MGRKEGSVKSGQFVYLLFVLWVAWAVASCARIHERREAAPAVMEVVPAASVKADAPADIFEVSPEPLTVADCARCHVSHYENLKDQGGKHRFDCQLCHKVFHAYNPRKNNFDEIMPKCASCHQRPHGQKHVDCLSCHTNPHTPRNVAYSNTIKSSCSDCHGEQAGQLAQHPSRHTKQECAMCHHEKHGYIPSCFQCHEPHHQGQPPESCTQCHPVHMPLQIAFTPEADARVCSGCHDGVYGMWSKTPSKHGGVNCSQCHSEHGLIPDCSQCHGKPHDESFHTKYPNCLTCHVNPHDLPVKM